MRALFVWENNLQSKYKEKLTLSRRTIYSERGNYVTFLLLEGNDLLSRKKKMANY